MIEITEKILENVSYYMDNDIREQVHFELAPCKPVEFLKRYIELDPRFKNVLKLEFNINI